MPHTDDDYQAESDLHALREAKAIKDDPSRLDRARNFASLKADELKQVADDLPKPKQRSRIDGARRS